MKINQLNTKRKGNDIVAYNAYAYDPFNPFANLYIGEDDPPADPPAEPPKAPTATVIVDKDEKGRPLYKLGDKVLLTQEHVNSLLAAQRRELAEGQNELTRELEKIRDASTTSETLRKSIERQLEELRAASVTEAEQLRSQLTTTEETYKAQLEEAEKAKNAALSTLQEREIAIEVAAGCAEFGAKSIDTIFPLLRPVAKFVDKLGEDKQPTGEKEIRIAWTKKEVTGEVKALSLTVPEVFKAMQNDSRFSHLFDPKQASGAGNKGPENTGTGTDLLKDQAKFSKEWKAARQSR